METVHAIIEIFDDINKNVAKTSGFNVQYERDSVISCWLDVDKYTITGTYLKIYSKKLNQTVYIPFDKIIKIEII